MNVRKKGHDYERKIREELRSTFFPQCETSRFASKMMDDLKVDLVLTDPFQIQCKAVEKLGGYHDILTQMPVNGKINAVFHKRNRKGEVVVVKKDDFYKIVEMLRSANLI